MKPRNKDLVPMFSRKQGAHVKSTKAIRRADKIRMLKEM
jgi:hypothetical protein